MSATASYNKSEAESGALVLAPFLPGVRRGTPLFFSVYYFLLWRETDSIKGSGVDRGSRLGACMTLVKVWIPLDRGDSPWLVTSNWRANFFKARKRSVTRSSRRYRRRFNDSELIRVNRSRGKKIVYSKKVCGKTGGWRDARESESTNCVSSTLTHSFSSVRRPVSRYLRYGISPSWKIQEFTCAHKPILPRVHFFHVRARYDTL